MAKRAAGDKELAFHKATKRWCKSYRLGGKKRTKYFCSGKGPDDQRSYSRALKQFQEWWPQVEAEKQLRRVSRRVGQYMAGTRSVSQLGDSPIEHQMRLMAALDSGQTTPQDLGDDTAAQWVKQVYPRLQDSETQRRERLSQKAFYAWTQMQQPPTPVAAEPSDHSISAQMDRWLAFQDDRQRGGEITPNSYKAMRLGVATFREFVGAQQFGEPEEVESLLLAYRGFLSERLSSGQFAAHTCNDKIKFASQFISWAYQQRLLKEQPRSLATFSRRFKVQREGHPLSVDDIRRLWIDAKPRLRCFIALGLNCGFKNKDITSLQASHLQDGRLIGKRSKTQVPMNYKLWPVTWSLIQSCRDDDKHETGGLVFANPDGNEISSTGFSATFKKLATRSNVMYGGGVKDKQGKPRHATFEQLRDTSTQAVEQYLMGKGLDQSIKQVFLAHKDGSTAAYYTSNDPRMMNTTLLDQVIDHLGEVYGLAAQ